jgi:hypothetical protein
MMLVGQPIEAVDSTGFWYSATIKEIDSRKRRARIHYNGWSRRHDVWMHQTSPKLRAVGTTNAMAISSTTRLYRPGDEEGGSLSPQGSPLPKEAFFAGAGKGSSSSSKAVHKPAVRQIPIPEIIPAPKKSHKKQTPKQMNEYYAAVRCTSLSSSQPLSNQQQMNEHYAAVRCSCFFGNISGKPLRGCYWIPCLVCRFV